LAAACQALQMLQCFGGRNEDVEKNKDVEKPVKM
jgi:hypothetical protein